VNLTVNRYKQAPSLHPAHTWRRSLTWITFGLCSALSIETTQATDLSEKLKTVYIANIVKFVTWPSTSKYIKFCLYSNANIHTQSSSLMNLAIGGGRHLQVVSNPADYTQCNLVYWDANSIQYRETLSPPNLLEISDMPDALALGMDVQLKIVENKMSFSIALSKIESNNFRISSKLLRLSKNGSRP